MGSVLVSNSISTTYATIVSKLKRTLDRIRIRRRKPANAATDTTATTHKCDGKTRLQPMPRCSTFETMAQCIPTLISLTKEPNKDLNYTEWKITFEASRDGQPTAATQQPIFSISETLSGQVSPNVIIPSHSEPTKTNRSSIQTTPTSTSTSKRSLSGSRELRESRSRLSLRLPLLNSSHNKDDARACKSATDRATPNKVVLTKESKRREMPHFLAKMPKQQALVIEKLYREIKDLEEYYGTRLDYYYL